MTGKGVCKVSGALSKDQKRIDELTKQIRELTKQLEKLQAGR